MVDTAVSIRGHCQATLRLQDELAFFRSHAREGSLRKELDFLFTETEIAVFLEKRASIGIVQRTGHDVPGDADLLLACRSGLSHNPAQAAKSLTHELEEGFVAREPNVIHALCAIKTKTCTLATGEDNERDFTTSHAFISLFRPFFLVLLDRISRGNFLGVYRSDFLSSIFRILALRRMHGCLKESLAARYVNCFELFHKFALLFRRKLFEELENMLLAKLGVLFAQLRRCFLQSVIAHCIFVFQQLVAKSQQ
mmetsp:Transcript_14891/g.28897  ORF Transcript_14891/g.28897 Transcript_14891/m.28897 type:complete len:253 (+) Transcript_14891:997-1755(+)